MSNNRTTDRASNNPGHIVCVGASAGGLEALIALLKFLPKNINMAFVLIQHLEPQHKSALPEILSRETSLNVREAKNNTKVRPSHVYVIPPNARMIIANGKLKITARVKRSDGQYLPIDFFMTSLAKDQGKKAIGIILSGTGSDGTLGAKAIKERGGTVFAQDENTARYFGMPGSVIASGSSDFVSAPKEIARRLMRPRASEYKIPLKLPAKRLGEQDSIKRILALLLDLTGADFVHYKQATIGRRIARRMSFHRIKNHSGYYEYLKANSVEADLLRKDILIPVTYFFRDPKMFSSLRKKAFPLIVNKRSPKNPIRLWVAACSSGEEVYSFAMALYEFLDERKIKPHIQIFGTDLSAMLIGKARAGLYAKDISAHVSAERLRRFFVKTETGYKINKQIRDLCVFAKHDITNDTPLSNMDIVSCRNLLIYLDAFLQNKALSRMHYALNPNGLLVLGTAESVMVVPGLFTAIDKKQKIYSKNIVSRRTASVTGAATIASVTAKANTRKAAKKVLPKQGWDEPLIIDHSKKAENVKRHTPKAGGPDKMISVNRGKDIVKLRKEFARTVKRLNAISEEKDTFNEELKAANEEIQSSNEELTSMNEELETSKEELQSTNEELLTLNEELQTKNSELTNLNSDLSNVFATTNIPMIFVDNGLRIKRFTPTARKVMNLIPSDAGRPIGDIKLNINIANLEEMIRGVIEDMTPKESEANDKEGRWYSVRIRPYRTVDNKIDGAVIAVIDIDTLKRSRDEARLAMEYSQAIIDTMREPQMVLDKDLRILSANRSFYNMFKVRASEVESKLLYKIGDHQWDNPKLRKMLEDVLPKKTHFDDFEVSFDFPGIGQKTMVLNGRQVKLYGKDTPMILLVIEDITKRKIADDVLRRDGATLEKIIKGRSQELLGLQVKLERAKHLSDIGTLAATVAHELRNTLAAISLAAYNIRKKIDDPRVAGSLDNIKKKVLEGDQIISNVLSYSKIKISHPEKVKINDILAICINEIKDRALSQGVSVSDEIGSTENLSIQADPVQMKEVFSNILNNALDAVGKNSGKIEIESEIKNSTVSIRIKDNGEGIAAEDLKKVLHPFFTTKAKGTGLGLAVCNQILMLHEGAIVIESDKGKGTKVLVTLPMHQSQNAENFTHR